MKSPFLARTAALLTFALMVPTSSQAFSFGSGSDHFASATPIVLSPGEDPTSFPTDLTNFTQDLWENMWGSGKTAWWKWQATENGYCTVDTLPTLDLFFPIKDTYVAVYTAPAPEARVARNDDYLNATFTSAPALSSATFYAVKNTTYYFMATSMPAVTASSYRLSLRVRLLPLRKVIRTTAWNAAPNTPDDMGQLTATTTATGALSGKLTIGPKTYPFAGVFGLDGTFVTSFTRKAPAGSQPLPPIALWIDGTGNGAYQVRANAFYTAYGAFPERLVFNAQNIHAVPGYYTGFLDGNSLEGFTTLTVKPTGVVTGSVTTDDGHSFTFSSALHQSTTANAYFVPFFKSLHGGKGGFRGSFTVNNLGGMDFLSGSARYIRPAGAVFYPNSIDATFSLTGGLYPKPTPQQRVLSFLNGTGGNGQMIFTDVGGELGGGFMEALNFTTANKFIFSSTARKPVLTLNIATGVVTGSINAPSAPPIKKRLLKGILYRTNAFTYLNGYVTGTTRNTPFQIVAP
ncbi:MAG: hypothetical protein V4599_13020 [Verrucomicrobiota bacterium]